VSGKNKSALQRNALRIANYLQQKSQQSESKGQLQNIAYTLQAGRNHYAHRLFVIAENTAHAATKLQAFDGQNLNSKVVEKQVKKVAFLFPGGGAQYSNMV
jgi:acyl transferase domain-containing protein